MRILVILPMALLLSACNESGPTAKSDSSGNRIVSINDGRGGSVDISTEKFMAAPKDLPAWAPLYPGSSVSQVATMSTPKGRMRTVMFESHDPPNKVIVFYDRNLEKIKMTPTFSTDTKDTFKRAFGGTENNMLEMITLVAADDGSTIGSMMYAADKQ